MTREEKKREYAEESTGNPLPAQSRTVVAAGEKCGLRPDPLGGAAVVPVPGQLHHRQG